MPQVELEARHAVLSPEEDIAGRLARLRGEQQPAGRGLKKESLPDPSLYLSPGQNQSPEVGDDGVDEVCLCLKLLPITDALSSRSRD